LGLAAYYLKLSSGMTEAQEFDYSKQDSAFAAVNFEESRDTSLIPPAVQYKAKELPKEKININNADAAKLATLPGIGIKTAEKIVDYRKKIKEFKYPAELMNIKGISIGKFEKIKNYIIVR